jgi:hypothetical protein
LEDVLPPEVREFALRNLDSVAQLEALLLMRREAETYWTSTVLAKRLYISENDAGTILRSLNSRGLIVASANADGMRRYRYSPDTGELERLVGETAEAYGKYLIPLTHLVHTKSLSSAQRFADAFRFRGKP